MLSRRSLAAYVRDYLAHEIIGEALTRDTAAFMRFFEALRFSHGELLDYSSIARDCAVSAKTVRTYFEILQDTLVGYLIYPFHRRAGRQSISASPKFHLFDVGIAGQVCGRRLTDAAGAEFGRAFEHFILLEIIAARSYREKEFPIQFWRTKTGLEVDFVLNRGEVAVEVKSRVRRGDDIDLIPWQDFLPELHDGEIS